MLRTIIIYWVSLFISIGIIQLILKILKEDLLTKKYIFFILGFGCFGTLIIYILKTYLNL